MRMAQEMSLRNNLDHHQSSYLYDDPDSGGIVNSNPGGGYITGYQQPNSLSHNSLAYGHRGGNLPQSSSIQEPTYVNSLSMNNIMNPATLRTMPAGVATMPPAMLPTAQPMMNVVTPSATMTPAVATTDPLLTLKTQLLELHKVNAQLRAELDGTSQKLQSSMSSIKTFWSPELKKERALRKEEIAKFVLVQEQLRLSTLENQVSASGYRSVRMITRIV